MNRSLLVAAGLGILLICCAHGAPITIAIEATIDTVEDLFGHLEGNISSGGFITGYYIYDSSLLDTNPSPSVGEWWFDVPCGVFLTAGGFQFHSSGVSTEFYFAVGNDRQDGDAYIFRSKYHLPLSNGVSVEEIIWQLGDFDATALDSDALPTTAPVLSAWDENRLYIEGGPRETKFWFDATVTYVEVVPEPSTILLIVAGALLVRKRTS